MFPLSLTLAVPVPLVKAPLASVVLPVSVRMLLAPTINEEPELAVNALSVTFAESSTVSPEANDMAGVYVRRPR